MDAKIFLKYFVCANKFYIICCAEYRQDCNQESDDVKILHSHIRLDVRGSYENDSK